MTEFSASLDAFMRALRSAQGRFNNAQAAPEISLPQYHLLEPLAAAGEPVSVGALADAAAVRAPSATRMLAGLEARGLVSRARGDEDRRLVRVVLTPTGAELVERKRSQIADARARIFNALPEADREAAARLLVHLADAIDDLHP